MPLFYQPSRSSRHRKACLALYKALQRIGASVPLPPDLETGLGPENPIKTLIRNGFRRNRKETSPRLVSAALKNGYRYIDLLSRAASDAASPERASVLQFLKENRDRVLWLKLKTAAKKAAEPNSAPVPGAVPVLTKISDPGDWQNPVYIPTKPVRPLSEIPGGIRKPPRLDAAGSVPFLRLGKPQGRHISRILWQKNTKRQARTNAIADMQTDEMEEAKIEDSWERLIAQQLADEGLWEPTHKVQLERGLQTHGELTFSATMYQGIMSLSGVLERERLDMIARAKAMLEIEQREQKLADQEDRERIEREGLNPRDVARFRMSRKRSKRGTKAGVFAQQPVQEEEVKPTAGRTRKSVGAQPRTHRDMIIGDAEIKSKTPERPSPGISDNEPEALISPPVQKDSTIPITTVATPGPVAETLNAEDTTLKTETNSELVDEPCPQKKATETPVVTPGKQSSGQAKSESSGGEMTQATISEPAKQQQSPEQSPRQQQPHLEQQKKATNADNVDEGQERRRTLDQQKEVEGDTVGEVQKAQKVQPIVASYTKKIRKRFTDTVDSEPESLTNIQETAQVMTPESPKQPSLDQQKDVRFGDGEGQQQQSENPVVKSYTKKTRKRFTDKFDSN